MTADVVAQYNEKNNSHYSFKVSFQKDIWLERLEAQIAILIPDQEEEYRVKSVYQHSMYNKIIKELMEEGVFTNAWFCVLDKSRAFDGSVSISSHRAQILNSEENNCEYKEEKFNKASLGFNGFEEVSTKAKMKR